jgi:hypothetical protein
MAAAKCFAGRPVALFDLLAAAKAAGDLFAVGSPPAVQIDIDLRAMQTDVAQSVVVELTEFPAGLPCSLCLIQAAE